MFSANIILSGQSRIEIAAMYSAVILIRAMHCSQPSVCRPAAYNGVLQIFSKSIVEASDNALAQRTCRTL